MTFEDNKEQNSVKIRTIKQLKIVELKNVSFRYPISKKVVLSNLNITFRKGELVALMGLSGSGKSSILDLLTRIIEPETGVIMLNGENVQNYDLEEYRKLFGYVGQEPALLDGTFEYNLRVRNPHVSHSELINVTSKLNLQSLIDDFPDGIDEVVGEMGVKLSGGQNQRVSIAGAFLKNSEFLIFDEPTSALDQENEGAFLKLLKQTLQMDEKLAIIVTHNWEVARKATRLIYIKDGHLIYDGPPDRHLLPAGAF